jgi:hypothetical protein
MAFHSTSPLACAHKPQNKTPTGAAPAGVIRFVHLNSMFAAGLWCPPGAGDNTGGGDQPDCLGVAQPSPPPVR